MKNTDINFVVEGGSSTLTYSSYSLTWLEPNLHLNGSMRIIAVQVSSSPYRPPNILPKFFSLFKSFSRWFLYQRDPRHSILTTNLFDTKSFKTKRSRINGDFVSGCTSLLEVAATWKRLTVDIRAVFIFVHQGRFMGLSDIGMNAPPYDNEPVYSTISEQ